MNITLHAVDQDIMIVKLFTSVYLFCLYFQSFDEIRLQIWEHFKFGHLYCGGRVRYAGVLLHAF